MFFASFTRLAIVSFILAISFYSHADDKKVLRVFNWSEYIAVDDSASVELPVTQRSPMLKAFAEKYDCVIEYYEYDDTPEMLKAVENTPGFYDVLVVSHADLKNLIKGNKIEKMNQELIPNIINISPSYRSIEGDKAGEYFAAYLVGTTGIVYRRDIVGYDVTSWKTLFEPEDKLKGKVNIFDDPVSAFPMAMQYLGQDPNSQDKNIIKSAGRLIYNLKKNGFMDFPTADIASIRTKLLSGEFAVSAMYSGDALVAMDEDKEGNLKYVIPNEGGEFYIDCFAVLKESTSKELAHQFINFALQPQVHAENAMYLQYLCPNTKATEFIKNKAPDQLVNPAIYPPKSTVSKLKQYGNSSPEIYRLWNKVFK